MLTPYDEFPVHQSPYPFSHIPSTDYNWDEGYWFGIFNPDEKVFLGTGFRVNPNTDMIGGYALLNVDGIQRTVRFNRCWRSNFNMVIGPYRLEVIEPMKTLRIVLEENESGISFDLVWDGASPAFEEEHHIAENRGRRTTDQTRYSQPGKVSGWIKQGEREWQMDAEDWSGSRDHSWGLYAERPPLAPVPSLLPPPQKPDNGEPERALRLWICFRTGEFSGFYHVHETADGVQCKMNDVFGTPFGGHVFRGWDSPRIDLTTGRHEMEFESGTRQLKKATLHLQDVNGGKWKQVFEVTAPPWVVQTMGYHPGSWKDGGNFFTYHGSEELALEWDEFDFSNQPSPYKRYQVSGESAMDNFGIGTDNDNDAVTGPEYLTKVTTYAPDGSVHEGSAHLELFINGAYHPYGLK